MNLAIIGSRNCKREVFDREIENRLTPLLDTYFPLQPDGYRLGMIISGGARGVDSYAREYALKHHLRIKEFIPLYGMYPPHLAPLMRNKEIVNASDSVLAFWDGRSHGTKYTLDYARQQGKPVIIVEV